ncbi:NAD-dependent epimerase/dehydratase family protein [Pedobacter sp. JY14-1]|uniref:NAD-dependent epimerase/dehydratase family protein n=1 Tax=Pedobacter sp. JY14-1 TaxID=3034151 RepID=UPI0023E2D5DA|nr:NAD-dependent epimerase/dehydratase family protein [Pedobacter sp. JY14-1]
MILVTGATGFLGAELVNQLIRKGSKVRALKRTGSQVPALIAGVDGIEWMDGDINDLASLEAALEGVTKAYHCAALVSFDPRQREQLFRVNIEGTGNIVNLCLYLGIRLLHVSSVAALGNARDGELITEEDFWNYEGRPHQYAISKYEGEMEVWRGIAEGLDAVIVNPSVIIGANAGYNGSGAIFKLVREGLSFFTDGATGIVDVQDVASSMIALMDSGETAERYIISAENYRYQQFFTEIAKGFQVKAPSKKASPWMLAIAWRAAKLVSLFTGKPAALTSDAARSSLNKSLYSNEKIRNTTGIHFKPLNQSIAEVCSSLA